MIGAMFNGRKGGFGLDGALGGTTSGSRAMPSACTHCLEESNSTAVHSNAARTNANEAMKPSSSRLRGAGCFFMALGFKR